MRLFEGKRVLNVGVKVSDEERKIFQEICNSLDRPMSYVVRELALRGLMQYLRDGQLKLTSEEIEYFQTRRENFALQNPPDDLLLNASKNRYHDEFAPKAHDRKATEADKDIYSYIEEDPETGEIIHRGGGKKPKIKKPSGIPHRKANKDK